MYRKFYCMLKLSFKKKKYTQKLCYAYRKYFKKKSYKYLTLYAYM